MLFSLFEWSYFLLFTTALFPPDIFTTVYNTIIQQNKTIIYLRVAVQKLGDYSF